MSNAKRPSLAPKHTRTTESNRTQALDEGLRITVPSLEEGADPDVYEVRIGEVTPIVVRELRRVSGFSFNSLCAALQTDPDADLVATWMWLAMRIEGNKVELEDVSLTYAQILGDAFDVSVAGKRGAVSDSPEA